MLSETDFKMLHDAIQENTAAVKEQSEFLKRQETLQVTQIKLLVAIALDGTPAHNRLRIANEAELLLCNLGYSYDNIHELIAKFYK